MQPVNGMRLGVDFGVARTGLAKVQLPGGVVVPIKTVATSWDIADEIADLVDELGIEIVYVGMPKLMSGSYGESARKVMQFARELSELARDVPIYLVDERLTTVAAHQKLHQAGKTTRDFKEIVDQQAAVEILQHAVNMEVANGNPVGMLVK